MLVFLNQVNHPVRRSLSIEFVRFNPVGSVVFDEKLFRRHVERFLVHQELLQCKVRESHSTFAIWHLGTTPVIERCPSAVDLLRLETRIDSVENEQIDANVLLRTRDDPFLAVVHSAVFHSGLEMVRCHGGHQLFVGDLLSDEIVNEHAHIDVIGENGFRTMVHQGAVKRQKPWQREIGQNVLHGQETVGEDLGRRDDLCCCCVVVTTGEG